MSPAGSNTRASHAAARAKTIKGSSPSESPTPPNVPTEVVTRLYKHVKLIKTAHASSKPSKVVCEGPIYSDNDKQDLDAVDDDEDYIESNFSSFPKPALSCNRIMGRLQKPDTSNMSMKQEKKALEDYEKKHRQYTDSC